jgi:tetratricopeptide (TPR) repeat protein
MAGRGWWVVVLVLVVAGWMPQSARAQEGRKSPPGREAAVFEFLMAEVAAQRGESGPAIATMARLAREMRDPKIARRAVEIAIRARALEPALDMAVLLIELEPESTLGRDLFASLIATRGDLATARDTIGAIVAASSSKPHLLSQLAYFFGRFPDKAAVLEATKSIASRYPEIAESHLAIGVAAFIAGDVALADAESKRALELKPNLSQGAIFRAQVLKKTAADQVIPYFQAYVARFPEDKDVRMQLAREFTTARRNEEARQEFRAIERLAPTDPQMPYAVGLLALQLEDYAGAETAFRRALGLGHPDPGAVYMGLGQAAESAKRGDEARDWYQRVEGADRLRAQMKIATLIAKSEGLAKGRGYLQSLEPRTQEDRVQMVLIEAQLLRDAKAWQQTYEMLTQAVESYPDSYEILYDRAMAAERVDRIDVLEKDLRRVIELKPDYAHAYNALGYTLADRTNRLEEAFALIEKAIKLSPEDPFILDSLGWVHYRLGNHPEALKHLNNAYRARPDPEIAAHLGEVLWQTGQREEANKVWKKALTDHPDHETLLAVMAKFHP